MGSNILKQSSLYRDSYLGFMMICFMLNPSALNAADLPPSPDDVAAFKQELNRVQAKNQTKDHQPKEQKQELNPQVANAAVQGQKLVVTEKDQTSKGKPAASSASPHGKSKADSVAVASDGESIANIENEIAGEKEAKRNALGNVISSEDQSVSKKIKEWSKKLGEFYQTFEEYMGWDETTRLRKLDEGCRKSEALSCYELGETRQREGKSFEAETWYQIACSLMHSPSCARYKRLASRRESYEEKLRQDRFEIETLCESGRGASCAKAAYIAKYFGEKSVAEALNLKSCDLGYPAGCLQMARLEAEKGNEESASVFEKRGRDLLESH